MTKKIRKSAPEGSTLFCPLGNKVKYYKKENGLLMKYIDGFGWSIPHNKPTHLHRLYPAPHYERICVMIALVLFWIFVGWVALS
jgi:hypothetical protein